VIDLFTTRLFLKGDSLSLVDEEWVTVGRLNETRKVVVSNEPRESHCRLDLFFVFSETRRAADEF